MTKKDCIEIKLNDYEKFINIAINEIDEKIKSTPPDKDFIIKKLEISKTYLLGIKWIPYNSTIFINYKKIFFLIDELKNKIPKEKKINKLILKQYNWR
jgi:hypothetical protein